MLEESRFPWTHGDADGTVAIDPEARSGERDDDAREKPSEPEARETKSEPRREEPGKGRTEGEGEEGFMAHDGIRKRRVDQVLGQPVSLRHARGCDLRRGCAYRARFVSGIATTYSASPAPAIAASVRKLAE